MSEAGVISWSRGYRLTQKRMTQMVKIVPRTFNPDDPSSAPRIRVESVSEARGCRVSAGEMLKAYECQAPPSGDNCEHGVEGLKYRLTPC